MRDVLKSVLKTTGLDGAARALLYARNPPAWYVQQRNEVAFYRQFVSRGSLCFDIGANIGIKARYFRMLGARVVCLEPVPSAVRILQEQYANDARVTIVSKAVGSQPGVARMHVGDSPTISSLSERWLERAKNTHRLNGREWPTTIDVRLTTLDELITEFGAPDFCKIDVEGFESEVLKGLSRPVRALSFEFQPEALDDVYASVEQISRLGTYSFNYSFWSPLQFELPHSVDASGIMDALRGVASHRDEAWGDVYATLGPAHG